MCFEVQEQFHFEKYSGTSDSVSKKKGNAKSINTKMAHGHFDRFGISRWDIFFTKIALVENFLIFPNRQKL